MTPDEPGKPASNNGPFKNLQGPSVSRGQKAPPTPVVVHSPGEGDDGELFAREMAWLKVRATAAHGDATGDHVPSPDWAATFEQVDAAEFLTAMGKIDKPMRDELPAEDKSSRARPRRMKQLEQGALQPAAELDLHGLSRDEALVRTRAFLALAARKGWPLVLIVTGRGLHSSEQPVLRRAVAGMLAGLSDLVLEWGEAPRRLGGAGALAVFVRVGQRPGRVENR